VLASAVEKERKIAEILVDVRVEGLCLNGGSSGVVAKPLRELVRVVGGGTPSKRNPAYWTGSIPWVSPKDFTELLINDSVDHISEAAVSESATNLVPAGSVLVVVRSGILRRKVPVAIAGRALAINQDLKALVPKAEVESQYLAYFLRGHQELLLKCVKLGATVQSIAVPRFLDIEIPIPDLAEQRRIAARVEDLLRSVDEARALNQAAQSDLDALGRSILSTSFRSTD
jgi:type I restriction enzyme S subunit